MQERIPDSIDAEYTNVTALAVRREAQVASWTPSFAVSVDEAIIRKKEKNRFFREVMDEGQHYGVIPGAGDKPALFKSGAEMLLSNMGLRAEFEDEDPPILDFSGSPEHGGEMLIHFRRKCSIYKQTGPTEAERMCMARASGACSSREKKYRFRNAQRACPECGENKIIEGKQEYGGGYLCFKKKGGCGAKFPINDRRISGQEQGQIANPDLGDIENTILKMADKRALVAATLIATGCSDIFTQDIEDQAAPQTLTRKASSPPSYEQEEAEQLPSVTELCKRAIAQGVAHSQSSFWEWAAKTANVEQGKLFDHQKAALLRALAAAPKPEPPAPLPQALLDAGNALGLLPPAIHADLRKNGGDVTALQAQYVERIASRQPRGGKSAAPSTFVPIAQTLSQLPIAQQEKEIKADIDSFAPKSVGPIPGSDERLKKLQQRTRICFDTDLAKKAFADREERLKFAHWAIGREIASFTELSSDECEAIMRALPKRLAQICDAKPNATKMDCPCCGAKPGDLHFSACDLAA
jgi:hypothetical protein